MRLVRYTPELFPALRPLGPPRSGLSHQPFVDHYYATREECQLQVLFGQDDATIGCIGIELMPFAYRDEPKTIAIATNYFALSSGAGGVLYLSWVKRAPISMVFGGSEDTHRILQAQKWTYYSGVQTWRANRRYPVHPGESMPRRLAKAVLRATTRKVDVVGRGARLFPASLEVHEELDYRDELASLPSPFTFRLAPDVAYLRWRYGLKLPFARYRLFTITLDKKLTGYVVLQDRKDEIVVSHMDGTDAALLALGTMKAIAAMSENDAHRRGILLTSAHPDMQRVFESFGLRPDSGTRSLVMRGPKGAQPFPADTSNWLTNFDWGDNSLRPPFPG
jgi:hypothetical protein